MLWIRYMSQDGDMKPKANDNDISFDLPSAILICRPSLIARLAKPQLDGWKEINGVLFAASVASKFDLGAWAEEKYVIPAKPEEQQDTP